MNIVAAPSSSADSYSVSEAALTSSGFIGILDVRANDGASRTRPIYSLDNGQIGDLAARDAVSSAETTPDRSMLGAAIWITADGRVGYSAAPISDRIDSLAAGQTLQDSFLYATQQANGSLLWTTVRITITGTNDAPVAVADVATVAEDSLFTGSVATNDRDVDNGAVLSFATSAYAPGFKLNSNGTWALDASDPAYQSLGLGQSKVLTIAYTVTDQFGARSSSTLTITVTGTNDAPVAGAVTAAVGEDGQLSGWLLGKDRDHGATLTYALLGDPPAGLSVAPDGAFQFDATHPAYASLAAGESATVVVSYSVRDEHGASGQATLTITVVGTNDGPLASASAQSVAEDGQVAGQLSAIDPDAGAALSFALAGEPPAGFHLDPDGSWTFDAGHADYQSLAADESLVVTIPYVVADEHGATASATLTLTVQGVNDVPVADAQSAQVSEGETVSGTLSATDPDSGAQLSFEAVGNLPAGFSLAADGGWSFDASAYDHLGAGETASAVLAFRVSDGEGGFHTSNLTVTINGVNDGPAGPAAPLTLADGVQGTAYRVTAAELLQGWSDADGDSLSVNDVQVAGATVTANADGSFTIMTDSGTVGALSLTYSVSDGSESRAGSATFTLNPAGNSAAGNFTGALTGSVREDRSTVASGNVDCTDVDDPSDSWRPVSTPAASLRGFGAFTVDASGAWSYQLSNDHPQVAALATGESLIDSFFLTTVDGTRVEVTVTINGRTDVVYVSPEVSTAPDSRDEDTYYSGYEHQWQRNYTAGPYDDLVQGSNWNDTLTGRDGYDRIYGHDGDDLIYGDVASGSVANGNDQLYGQRGNDTIYGGSGSDRIHGGSGDDVLYGNGTDAAFNYDEDRIHGGSGNDRIVGGDGADIITGGTGADVLTGGLGRDMFYVHSAAETGDTITDFQQGQDRIMINNLYLSRSNFVGALTGAGQVEAGEVGYFVEDGTTTIYIDTDGVAGADLEIKLVGTYALTSNDFGW